MGGVGWGGARMICEEDRSMTRIAAKSGADYIMLPRTTIEVKHTVPVDASSTLGDAERWFKWMAQVFHVNTLLRQNCDDDDGAGKN